MALLGKNLDELDGPRGFARDRQTNHDANLRRTGNSQRSTAATLRRRGRRAPGTDLILDRILRVLSGRHYGKLIFDPLARLHRITHVLGKFVVGGLSIRVK